MRKGNHKLFNNTSLFLIVVLVISIGFAYLSTNLNINGITSLNANTWDVYFDNVQVISSTVNTATPVIDANKTTVNYVVTLEEPGDYFEFTVDAVNDGTIDAMVDSVVNTQLSNNISKLVDYTITYSDGTKIKQNDVLKSGRSATYKIRLEYKKDILVEDLLDDEIELDLSFSVNYVQYNSSEFTFAKMVKDTILSDNDINFKAISSDENGKGLYVRSGTENDTYPIYYYRGAVTNNNAKFAGFCWKIVRTTDTGGIKLIYNGLPDNDGNCTNTTGSATQIGTSKFNMEATSPTFSSYMYGEIYTRSSTELSSNYLYGNGFSFTDVDSNVSGDGTYKLKITTSDITISNLNNYHYTCFNATGECSQINYIYYIDETTAYYITIKDGKTVSDALDEMMENETDSTIKTYIDNWFKTNFVTYFTNKGKDYKKYLEDTIWCNDRSFRNDTSGSSFEKSGWNPNGGNNRVYLNYDALGRRDTTGQPTMDCKNKKDAFTVNDTTKGNGLLKYPVGLLTADEIMLAGGWVANNTSYYLYTNQNWWSLSPGNFTDNGARVFNVNTDGYLNAWYAVTNSYGVRPSISLKHAIKAVNGGDGTTTKPYTFVID